MSFSMTSSSIRLQSSVKWEAVGRLPWRGWKQSDSASGEMSCLLELLLDDAALLAGAVEVHGRPGTHDPLIRSQLVELAAQAEAAIAFVGGHITRESEGRAGSSDGAVGKILYTETYNRIARFGVQLATDHPTVGSAPAALAAARLRDAWLWSRALTISGGSSEIMRNIIARHRLHLPSQGSGR